MNKKSTPFSINRPTGRIPKLTPPAQPGWYKHFRQLASLANKSLHLKHK